ncbi:SbmA/BacA-like family transporter [Xenorhabdus bovienii]|uniref:SbmA/BacA-like family transporter n=1 Tax=Xenorhabdus bovienii TaxID=40576 RepID=UPI00215811DC|nr:SbmA/BacA-like family transporter [Xenorhabdus bovienii]
MNEVIVTTKEELKKAKDDRIETIIVQGELADNLQRTKKITYLSAGAIAALMGAIALIPATGGLSAFVGIAPIAALTGLDIGLIIGAISIGVGLLVAIYKEYDEIKVETGYLKLSLKRKK